MRGPLSVVLREPPAYCSRRAAPRDSAAAEHDALLERPDLRAARERADATRQAARAAVICSRRRFAPRRAKRGSTAIPWRARLDMADNLVAYNRAQIELLVATGHVDRGRLVGAR